jgi:hypothetical protein
MMPSTMKHLLNGVAVVAALAIAAPVWAQTSAPMAPSSRAPAAAAPAATAPTASAAAPAAPTAKARHKRVSHHKATRRGMTGKASPDNIANQLNAQELARVGSSSAPDMAGSRGGGYGRPSPTQRSAPGGLMAPGTLGGGYGQPAPTQGIPGGNQPSASSHPPR